MSTNPNGRKLMMLDAALMGAGLNINTSNWFGPKGSTGNKYQPHQGKQEIARRLRGKPVSKPRRMWVLSNVNAISSHAMTIDRARSMYVWETKWPTRTILTRLGKISRYPVVLLP